MDWREFFKGFLGGTSPPSQSDRDPNVWPPPPPILNFAEENPPPEGDTPKDNGNLQGRPRTSEMDEPTFPGRGFFWGQGPSQEGSDEGVGSQFVFSDMFAAVGEMFQEMERSMQDMERFFGNADITIEGNTPRIHPNPESTPAISPSGDPLGRAKKEENVRNFVLKESDTPNRSRHYLAEPEHSSDKVDRDLDYLYQKSMLDLSDLPVPSKEESQPSNPTPKLSPYDSQQGKSGGAPQTWSFGQRTYQTFTFKNGRMEGETVKEDETGRHVTKYYQDENGQKHETTEFFPRDGSPSRQGPEISDPSTSIVPSNGPYPFLNLLDRIFRPRM